MFRVQVPATSANLGPGFDSIGMALSLYNTIEVAESDHPLEIVLGEENDGIPKDESNLIYQTMQQFYEIVGKGTLPNIKLTQTDHIPLTRGLGSSAACIVGGLFAANTLSGAKLSREELAYLAAKIEGHPDNSTPAIFGGVVVGVLTEKKLEHIQIQVKNVEQLHFAVMIPDFQVSTEKSRHILPKTYDIQDVVYNVSRAGLLVAALTTGDFDKLSIAMDDRLHQPYRKTIIPNMEAIFEKSFSLGAKSVFLSGAGPTLIAFSTEKRFLGEMQQYLDTLDGHWQLHDLKLDLDGTQIFYH